MHDGMGWDCIHTTYCNDNGEYTELNIVLCIGYIIACLPVILTLMDMIDVYYTDD